MRELIQAEFLTPLSAVFGAHGPRLADELAKRIPPATNGDAMRGAAEKLIRTRRAKGFPPFPECLSALNAVGGPRGGPSSGITAKNYAGRAIDYCKSNYRAGEWPVIERKVNEAEWKEWQAYFYRLGMRGSAQMMNDAEKWSVPALSPADFDSGARRAA